MSDVFSPDLINAINTSGSSGTAPAANQNTFDDSMINAVGSNPAPAPVASAPSPAAPGKFDFDETPGSTLLTMASGVGANIIGGWKGLTALATGKGLDAAVKAVNDEQQQGTYQPKAGSTAASINSAFASPYNPLNYISEAGNYLGAKTTDLTGSPALGTAVNVGLNAAPLLLSPEVRGTVGKVLAPINPISIAKNDIAAGITKSVINPAEDIKPIITPEGLTVVPNQSPAVTTTANTAKAVQEPISVADAVATPNSKLSASDQQARSSILARVGISPEDQRVSAVTGDQVGANDDMQAAKSNTSLGSEMRNRLDAERAAITNHAESIVQNTGGTLGTDEATLNDKGQTIAAPFDALKGYFKNATTALYKAADEQAGGKPSVNLTGTQELLGQDDAFMGKAENGSLRTGIQAYMKRMNISNPDGSMNPVTAQQAEGLRQYINSQWSPETSGLAGKIKGAIDGDVFSAAGGDIYQQARQMAALKKATLDNPSGISKIMDYDPQTPINRTTPFNKIPDTLTRLPPDQFKHVISVLDNVPTEIQPLALAAKNEIKGQMANQLLDAGSKTQTQWNAPGVANIVKNNSAKYPMVFSPAEISKINDLRDAGNISFIKGGYPGAGIQSHNLMNAGLMAMPSVGIAAGETLGSVMGMPGVGSVAGGIAANKVSNFFSNKLNMGAVTKRFGTSNIRNFPK